MTTSSQADRAAFWPRTATFKVRADGSCFLIFGDVNKGRHEIADVYLTEDTLRDLCAMVNLYPTLIAALRDLRSYAASVWFDEATASDEEREIMSTARSVLDAAKGRTDG